MRLSAVSFSGPRPNGDAPTAPFGAPVACGGLGVAGRAPIAVDTVRAELCGPVTQALTLACGAEPGRAVEAGWPRRLALGPVDRPPVVFVSAANVTACGVGFLACARGAIAQVLAEDEQASVTAGVWLGLGVVAGALALTGLAATLMRPGRGAAYRASPELARVRPRGTPPPPSYGAVDCST